MLKYFHQIQPLQTQYTPLLKFFIMTLATAAGPWPLKIKVTTVPLSIIGAALDTERPSDKKMCQNRLQLAI